MSQPLFKGRPPATAETPAQMRALEELVLAREHQDGKMLAVNDARLRATKRGSELAAPGSDEVARMTTAATSSSSDARTTSRNSRQYLFGA